MRESSRGHKLHPPLATRVFDRVTAPLHEVAATADEQLDLVQSLHAWRLPRAALLRLPDAVAPARGYDRLG